MSHKHFVGSIHGQQETKDGCPSHMLAQEFQYLGQHEHLY